MKNSKVLMLAVMGLFLLGSCSKDDESATDYLTGGTWKITESRSDIDGDGDLDDDLESCSRDDEYDFEKDGTLNFDDGAVKCDPTDPQTTTGVWALSGDEKTLTLTVDGFGFAFEVISLTKSRMELRSELFGYTSELVFTR
ncbi:MAG: lipocalin family protein [Saprospiraceae bacterium]